MGNEKNRTINDAYVSSDVGIVTDEYTYVEQQQLSDANVVSLTKNEYGSDVHFQ